jgi:hypothetical protein
MGYNKTTLYLAGMLDYNLKDLIETNAFINCYLGDHSFPVDYSNHIYVRIKFSPQVQRIIEAARKSPSYEIEYDLPNGEIMLVFRIDSKYSKDVAAFRAGKYSKIDREYVQKVFPKGSKRYKILTLDEGYKKALVELYHVRESSIEELESNPSPVEEIFRFNDQRGW